MQTRKINKKQKELPTLDRKISEDQADYMINIILKGKLFKKPEDIKAAWASAGLIQGPTENIEIELSDKDFIKLARAAHKSDITFNEQVENGLREYINKVK